ncbi:hypothetical protein CH338_31305, partial [Rhodoplanes elegans]
IPCVERFEALSDAARAALVPTDTPVVVVEAGATRGWRGLAGRMGAVIGLDRFGESAPERDLLTRFGFTKEAVAGTVRTVLAG